MKTELVYAIVGMIIFILVIGLIQYHRNRTLHMLTKYRRLGTLEAKIVWLQAEMLSSFPLLLQFANTSSVDVNTVSATAQEQMLQKGNERLKTYNDLVDAYNAEMAEAKYIFCRKVDLPRSVHQTLPYSFISVDLRV